MSNSTCPGPNCNREIRYKGLCAAHYRQAHKGQALRPIRELNRPIEITFWEKVKKTDSCWLWQGYTRDDGYAQVRVGKRRSPAHRVAYELEIGPIPDGAEIDHICHNTSCVRPDHLRPVTPGQNRENRLGARAGSSSGVRGVCWSAKSKKWQAQAYKDGTNYHCGLYDTVEEAAEAARAKRLELFTHNDADRVNNS